MKTIKTTLFLSLPILFSTVMLFSCKETPNTMEDTAAVNEPIESPEVTRVMTKEDQDNLTPQMVIDDFKAGNERFVNQQTTNRNHGEQIRKTALAQYPKAIVLSCVDSRVPVEDLFDQGIGDVFVGRVAGNFVNEDLLGSMEFATKVAGAKLVVILGHKYCGAVKGAIDNAQLGNLTAMLENIKPAVKAVEEPQDQAIRNSKNEDFVEAVSDENVRLNIEKTLAQSPVLAEMQEKGEIKIVGATYDLSNGKVIFFE
ncbi:carbonic anhydrase [Gelidibacter algens]|uniref:Carbonic anhydrase n=1 Tax=Gelidibacter algens TaxID=49280 RepID=A0A1A7QRU4_9FLAO|nr:carbonic anhydrase family protein [Gelidibacter algens]OBX22745.1 carbonic anhydrase [Gelidibacter algens]RAJ20785.1 carbonic anhydrase [Gelidibacter algens]